MSIFVFRLLNLWDCRQCTSQRQWSLPTGEVEKVQWNQFDPFRFLVTSDAGDIFYIDSRQESVGDENRVEKAHEDAVSGKSDPSRSVQDGAGESLFLGLALHSTAKNCLATCGVDGVVKIWSLDNAGQSPLRLVTKKKLKLVRTSCLSKLGVGWLRRHCFV